MNIENELKHLADRYTSEGYRVTLRPTPKELPPFAQDFRIEIAAIRGTEGVLVTVKKNREEVAADSELPRYAEVTGSQPGWRFDLVVLEAEPPRSRDIPGSQDFSDEDIARELAEAEHMTQMGFVRPAIMTAWSALEAAMRICLRAAGEEAGSGTMPRSMINELYSSGSLSSDEFGRLERLSQVRNQIAHGFSSPTADAGVVHFMSSLARRLLDESHSEMAERAS